MIPTTAPETVVVRANRWRDARRLPVLARVARPPPSPAGPSRPTYLRAVVNAVCPLACSFCHREGDPAVIGRAQGLAVEEWIPLLEAAVDAGVRKIKLLGGEPLLRADLPHIVGALHRRDPALDLSVITSGAVPTSRIDALFAAGLTRCNVSIHGFGLEAFRARTGSTEAAWRMRNQFLARVIAHGRPLKTNYVYTGADDLRDLGAYLDFACARGLLVNLLDDLSRADLDLPVLEAALRSLRGEPRRRWIEEDPHSLPTTRLGWDDGLVVELKHVRLGDRMPWTSCADCGSRSRCREGIHALRISHTGILYPCMDRPDLGVPLLQGRVLRGDARATIESFIQENAR